MKAINKEYILKIVSSIKPNLLSGIKKLYWKKYPHIVDRLDSKLDLAKDKVYVLKCKSKPITYVT